MFTREFYTCKQTTMAERGNLWSPDEIRTLIGIWGKEDIQAQLDGMYRNNDVYKNIADEMQSLGFNRTDKQCRVKIPFPPRWDLSLLHTFRSLKELI